MALATTLLKAIEFYEVRQVHVYNKLMYYVSLSFQEGTFNCVLGLTDVLDELFHYYSVSSVLLRNSREFRGFHRNVVGKLGYRRNNYISTLPQEISHRTLLFRFRYFAYKHSHKVVTNLKLFKMSDKCQNFMIEILEEFCRDELDLVSS